MKIFLLDIFIFVCLATAIFLPLLDKPLTGYHDWNSVVYAVSGRSLAGMSQTDGIFYQHNYPAGLPLSLSAVFLIFGVSEASVRGLPVVFTLAAAVMFYIFLSVLFSRKIAVLAASLYVCTPLVRYFGKIPVHETVMPFFLIMGLWLYWRWYSLPKPGNLVLLIAALVTAQQYGWPGYFLTPLISLHWLIFKKTKKGSFLVVWLAFFLSLAIFLLSELAITGEIPLRALWQIFKFRTGTGENPYSFGLVDYLKKELLWLRVWATYALCFMAGLGFLIWAKQYFGQKQKDKLFFVPILFLMGIAYLLIFRQAAWLHDYVIIYLFPLLCLLASFFLVSIAEKIKVNFYLVGFLALLLVIVQSRQFLHTLEQANDFYPAYYLGNYINKNTNPADKFYIAPTQSGKFYGVYLDFYADRVHDQGDLTGEDFELKVPRNYALLVIDSKYNMFDREFTDYLAASYNSVVVGQFTIIDLR